MKTLFHLLFFSPALVFVYAAVDLNKLKHTNVVLFGATGDLAKRYLWRGLFEQFRSDFKGDVTEYAFYGAARKDPEKGRVELSQILLNSIKCKDDDCRSMKKRFVQATQYVQLKTEKHFLELKNLMDANTITKYGIASQQHNPEVGRIIYLSIPPSAYTLTANLVHKYLRPVHSARAWLRVVLEKPFGHDEKSARDLSDALQKLYHEDEIYRIDHYLGKTVSRQILPFRTWNRNTYDAIFNRRYVERVDISMKEQLDCAGRTDFYDDVGVVRDVMQNHLTELLVLVAMDLPINSGNITELLQNKIHVLKNTLSLGPQHGLIGQYRAYQSQRSTNQTTVGTATFGAAALAVNTERWRGVPFLLMSGKKMDEKASYVRVTFKRGTFCMKRGDQLCHQSKQPFAKLYDAAVYHLKGKTFLLKKHVVFHIGGNDVLKPPMIASSNGLPPIKHGADWKPASLHSGGLFFGEVMDKMNQILPEKDIDAYVYLIQAVFKGERHLFTSTDNLLESWRVWDGLIRDLDKRAPRMYEGHDVDPVQLQFSVTGSGGLEYDVTGQEHQDEDEVAFENTKMATIPPTIRGQRLVSGSTNGVIKQLAAAILNGARDAILDRGVFHLALSGGSSPIRLLNYMTTNFITFPWHSTHIWQVDERCVESGDARSNFRMIETHLLSWVSVPFRNIHAMKTEDFRGLCAEADEASESYESDMKRAGAEALDFVVLGVGEDGHTASLFPGEASLDIEDRLVALTTGGPEAISSNRISLTLPAINKAHSVAVLATGIGKHNMLSSISKMDKADRKFPITMVDNEQLVWYADYSALLGK